MSKVEKEVILDEDLSETLNSEEIKDETEAPEEKQKSRVPIYVVAGIIAGSLIVGLIWWIYSRQFVSTDDAFIEGNITIVSPKITSHVTKIYITENQLVKKGNLLLELDPPGNFEQAPAGRSRAADGACQSNQSRSKRFADARDGSRRSEPGKIESANFRNEHRADASRFDFKTKLNRAGAPAGYDRRSKYSAGSGAGFGG